MAEDTSNGATPSRVMSWLALCISTGPRGTTPGLKGQEHDGKTEEFAAEATSRLHKTTTRTRPLPGSPSPPGPSPRPPRIGVTSPRPRSSRRECPDPGSRASARCPDPDPAEPSHPPAGLPHVSDPRPRTHRTSSPAWRRPSARMRPSTTPARRDGDCPPGSATRGTSAGCRQRRSGPGQGSACPRRVRVQDNARAVRGRAPTCGPARPRCARRTR